jgi:hypothetical protein
MAAVAAVLVVLTPARPTGAQNPGETCVPFNDILFSGCTGEFISISGEMCLEASLRSDASGGTHATGRGTITGTGVGLTSGTQYILQTVTLIEENINLGNNLQDEATITADAVLISRGSMPNEKVTTTAHATVNADGTMTVNFVTVTDNCHG